MKKPFTIAGAVAGLGYTAWGMAASYRHMTNPLPVGRIALEFVVLAGFTAVLGACIGIGLGLLLDGLLKRK